MKITDTLDLFGQFVKFDSISRNWKAKSGAYIVEVGFDNMYDEQLSNKQLAASCEISIKVYYNSAIISKFNIPNKATSVLVENTIKNSIKQYKKDTEQAETWAGYYED